MRGARIFGALAVWVALNVAAAPFDMLGVKVGAIHRITLDGQSVLVRVLTLGKEGWVQFEIASAAGKWEAGTKVWVNVDRLPHIIPQ
jgi:hypothetical protein